MAGACRRYARCPDLLLHVTAAIVIVFGVFSALDSLADRQLGRALWGRLAAGPSGLVVLIGVRA